jgi:nitroimidazol reductase NimA-like FMN-containing flavoprotein (pyridoxamine 5'-phosphate oxidase superfamily)
MRRKDKEIKERSQIEEIIRCAQVCRLAMVDNGEPYMVPLCFGYADNALYFHTGPQGRKIDVLKKNNRVCFEMDIDCQPKAAETACKWSMNYKSVIGFGRATFIDADDEKRKALDLIMQQYAGGYGSHDRIFSGEKVDKTLIIKVEIEKITGKQSI